MYSMALKLLALLLVGYASATAHKYSPPLSKHHVVDHPRTTSPPIPTPTTEHKKYVNFDLKPQGSRYGDPFHQHFPDHSDHYYGPYPDYHYPAHYEKSHDNLLMIPVVLGGLGVVLLPLITLLMTLAVNIAPASNIPTAVTTATGKFLKATNSTEFLTDLAHAVEAAITKYGKLNKA